MLLRILRKWGLTGGLRRVMSKDFALQTISDKVSCQK